MRVKDFRYGYRSLEFGPLSFEVNGVLAVMGPNGVGKSSLLRALVGGIKAFGYIEVDGKVIHNGKKGLKPEKRPIAYVPQKDPAIPFLTVEENLMLACKEIDENLLDELGIKKYLNVKVAKLSGGQRKRVGIAMALSSKKKVLLLDEPLSGIDPESRELVIDVILKRSKGKDIVWVTHFEDVLKFSNSVLRLQPVRSNLS